MKDQKDVSKSKKRRERKKKIKLLSSKNNNNTTAENLVDVNVVNDELKQNDDVTTTVKDSCPICGEEENLKTCMGCLSVSYCQIDHQKQHWKIHKKDCCPFKITVDPVMGKQMIAARDLKAGTLVLEEFPVLFYPSFVGLAFVCLSCGLDFQGEQPRLCSTCRWPICSPECEQVLMHKENECYVFSRQKTQYPVSSTIKNWFHRKFNFQLDNSSTLMVLCFELIRGLRLKIVNPKKYNNLMNEIFHLNRLPQDDFDSLCDQAIAVLRQLVDVKDLLNGEDISEDEILELVKAICCNNYGNCVGGNKRNNIHGTFLRASRLNHSCSPNCHNKIIPVPSEGFAVKIQTLTNVSKGEPLTFNYSDDDDLIRQGRTDRQKRIWDAWGFVCHCLRCLDPTEFGTYMDGVCCQRCRPKGCFQNFENQNLGYFLPVNPTDFPNDSALWKCNRCEATESFKVIMTPLTKLRIDLDGINAVDTTPENKFDLLDDFIQKCLKSLHHHNFIVKSAIEKVAGMWDPSIVKLDRQGFDAIYSHLRYLVNIYNKIAPGLSSVRIKSMSIMCCLISCELEGLSGAFTDAEKIKYLTQVITYSTETAMKFNLIDNNQEKVKAIQEIVEETKMKVSELGFQQLNLT